MMTFWQSGYETTSISDLTAAMGITAPSIYTAFGDKKQLFLEAMTHYAGTPEELDKSLHDATSAREAAEQMLLASAKAFTGDATPKGCLLASATASGSKHSIDVQSAVADVRGRIAASLRRRIEHDIDIGLLPKTTDSRTLALMIIATIQGMSVLARDGVPRAELLALAKTAMAVWPGLPA